MAKAVGLPVAAMGGYAGLKVAANQVPAVDRAFDRARSQSWRGLLAETKSVGATARQAASRGAAASKAAATKATKAAATKAAAASTRAATVAVTKVAPRLLGRAALMTGARLALVSIPVAGGVIAAATWLFDKDSRSLVNGLISSLMGVGFAPDGDAPPWNVAHGKPDNRTWFLPLTNDGNRDKTIQTIDSGMKSTNDTAFGYSPDKVWPAQPQISTTPDFSQTLAAANKLGPQASSLADSIRAVANTLTGTATGRTASAVPAALGPVADALDGYRDIASTTAAAVNAVTTRVNDFYQQFRQINNSNRAQIADSTSGLIPFRANHVNAAAMDDSVAASQQALSDIGKHNTDLAAALSNWKLPAPTGVATAVSGRPTKPAPLAPAAPIPPAPTPVPAPTDNTEPKKSPLDSLLSSLPSSVPPIAPPGIPPTSGLIPQIPTPPPAAATPLPPEQPPHPPEEKEPEPKPEKPGEEHKPGEPLPGPGVVPGPAPDPNKPGEPAPAPQPPPGADRIVRIGDKDFKFDSPRVAAAIRATLAAAENGPGVPIPQVLADQGFVIPPPGHDLGEFVPDINKATPGDVIASDGNQHAWNLGDGTALTEQGEIKPVNEVMNFTGPNQGIFHVPDPGTPVIDPTAAPVAPASALSTSPPVVTAADVPPPQPQPTPQPGR